MAAQTAMLHVRVDEETKDKAAAALKGLGLSVSDAIRLFLYRVVADDGFPLELKKPNAETRSAMAEADEIAAGRTPRFTSAEDLFADLEKSSRE